MPGCRIHNWHHSLTTVVLQVKNELKRVETERLAGLAEFSTSLNQNRWEGLKRIFIFSLSVHSFTSTISVATDQAESSGQEERKHSGSRDVILELTPAPVQENKRPQQGGQKTTERKTVSKKKIVKEKSKTAVINITSSSSKQSLQQSKVSGAQKNGEGGSGKQGGLASPNLIKQVKATNGDKNPDKKADSNNGLLESPGLLRDINGGSQVRLVLILVALYICYDN